MAKRGGFPGGGMPGNMSNLMKQAQRMQRQMEESAKELETAEFTATAGGGAVEVTVTGKKEVTKVKLDPEQIKVIWIHDDNPIYDDNGFNWNSKNNIKNYY